MIYGVCYSAYLAFVKWFKGSVLTGLRLVSCPVSDFHVDMEKIQLGNSFFTGPSWCLSGLLSLQLSKCTCTLRCWMWSGWLRGLWPSNLRPWLCCVKRWLWVQGPLAKELATSSGKLLRCPNKYVQTHIPCRLLCSVNGVFLLITFWLLR